MGKVPKREGVGGNYYFVFLSFFSVFLNWGGGASSDIVHGTVNKNTIYNFSLTVVDPETFPTTEKRH